MRTLLRTFALLLAALPVAPLRAQTPAPAQTQPAAPAPTSDPQSTFSLITGRVPITELDGLWRFHAGDDTHWADPAFNDSQWQLVNGEYDWHENGLGNLSGFGWYRLRVTLPAGEEPYSLRLPPIATAYQLFADGRPIYGQGSLDPNSGPYWTIPALVEISSESRPAPRTILLALRIWQYSHWAQFYPGGLRGTALVGRTDLLETQQRAASESRLWQYSDDFDLGALYLLACVIAFALFLSRRSETEYSWFALLAFCRGASHLIDAYKFLNANALDPTEIAQNLFNTGFLVASVFFYKTLLEARRTRAFRFVLICCGIMFVDSVLLELNWISVPTENFIQLVVELPIYAWIILLVRRRARQRRPDARLLATPVALLLLAFLYQDFIWWLNTLGLSFVTHLEIRIRHPFYLKLTDVAEGFFLIAMLAILLTRFSRTRREQDRVASEFEAARSVQQVLVPESLPSVPGLSISTAYHPAEEVGGDFFQVLPLRSGGTLIVLGDVAGKGLPAALTVSLAVGALRTIADYTESPGELLTGLNRRLFGRGPGFTTCLALHLSPDCTVLTVANAGHLAPYVNGFELHTLPSLPLGLDPDATFDESRWGLKPGDHLVALTDGVPEAMKERELFGFERTAALTRGSAAQIAQAAQQFGQNDDITVLTLDVLAVPSSTEPERPVLQPA